MFFKKRRNIVIIICIYKKIQFNINKLTNVFVTVSATGLFKYNVFFIRFNFSNLNSRKALPCGSTVLQSSQNKCIDGI